MHSAYSVLVRDYHALIAGKPELQTALYLARLLVSVCATTQFPLHALIAQERAQALTPDEPPIDAIGA